MKLIAGKIANYRRTLVIFITIVAVLLSSTTASAEWEDSYMSVWDEGQAAAREHVNGRYETLRAELEAAQQEIIRLKAELTNSDMEIAELKALVVELNEQIEILEARIAELEQPAPPGPVEPTAGLWYQAPDLTFNNKRPYLWHVVPWMTGKSADTWRSAYLAPSGEAGKHAAYGGYVRDMPLGYTAAWQVEVAKAHGVDGFFVDLVAPDLAAPRATGEHGHAAAVRDLLTAAGNFKIVPMIDANGTQMKAATPVQIAAGLARFFNRPSTWTINGKPVVGAFKAEGWAPQRWTDIIAALKNLGHDALIVAALNEIDDATKYPMFYGVGQWSPGADAALLSGAPRGLAATVQRGQVPVVPVLPSNIRMYSGQFDEQRGTASLRASLRRILAAGDVIVQAVTANDYAEGSSIEPSALHGSAYAAYTRWRLDCWRAGRELPILKPTVFVSHRPQLLGAAITSGQTKTARQWLRGDNALTAVVDEIEVLTLLPASTMVTVTIGGESVRYQAPAGEHVEYLSARAGVVSVLVAGVQVTSPVPIATRGINDMPNWLTVWSGDTAKVFDPRPAP